MSDMNTPRKQFIASMEDTFRTPGWKLLIQGWQEEQKNLPAMVFFNAKSMEDIDAARVRFNLLNELIDLPETIEGQKAEIENG